MNKAKVAVEVVGCCMILDLSCGENSGKKLYDREIVVTQLQLDKIMAITSRDREGHSNMFRQ